MTTAYLAVARGIRELHHLTLAGLDESTEADAIRDAVDAPWQDLSEAERDRARALSEDLYSITDSRADLGDAMRDLGPQAHGCLRTIKESRRRGEIDQALALLRQSRGCLPMALVSYLRGSLWRDLGDEASARLFYDHASKLQPGCEANLARLVDSSQLAE